MDMTHEQKELEFEVWERFKEEVQILKGYKFTKEQLIGHIRIVYGE